MLFVVVVVDVAATVAVYVAAVGAIVVVVDAVVIVWCMVYIISYKYSSLSCMSCRQMKASATSCNLVATPGSKYSSPPTSSVSCNLVSIGGCVFVTHVHDSCQ